MAYNFFPATYPQMNYPQAYQQQYQQYQQQQTSGILWVQGLEGAKAYPVATGATVLLMDSEESVFYIKSTDTSGMPNLRTFDYKERNVSQNATPKMEDYVTRDEFEKRLAELVKEDNDESII